MLWGLLFFNGAVVDLQGRMEAARYPIELVDRYGDEYFVAENEYIVLRTRNKNKSAEEEWNVEGG